MKTRKLCISTTLILAASLLSGCQNTLTIRVQRALVPSALELKHNSRLGERLDAADNDLTKLIRVCESMDAALTRFVEGLPRNWRPAAEDAISGWREQLGEVLDRARHREEMTAWALREKCRSYFDIADITTKTQDIYKTLWDVDAYLDEATTRLGKYIVEAEKTNALNNLAKTAKADLERKLTEAPENRTSIDKIKAAEKPVENAQLELSATVGALSGRPPQRYRGGFGGFVATDVYEINPSNPKYAGILKTHGPWMSLAKELFWQDVSAETLTMAQAGVTGDSAIIFVVEHPGQVRVYQVSLDPTQITSNIGLLVSKAAAAGAKYMSAGLVP